MSNTNVTTTTLESGNYAAKYSESGFFSKVGSAIKSAGLMLIYEALQLFYVTENPNCPLKIKAAIFAALGYFISPLDIVPDFIPVAGYTDDGGAIALALCWAQLYIDDTVRQKARDKIRDIFGAKVAAELT